ncbi:MAG: hypothetical protein AB7G75_29825 [Candidatus Binatia bacterium]
MASSGTSKAALNLLKKQASKVLSSVQKEIGQREKELLSLRQDEARLRAIVSGRSVSAAGVGLTGGRTRLDWNVVLSQLPNTFTSKDVAQKSGKPMEQVYAGLNRWIKDNKVRKGKDGYQKVGASAR